MSVALFDVAGRKVSTLFDGTLGAGPHEFQWDLRTGEGSPAASGIYFLRAQTEDRQAARRIILAR